MKSVTEGRMSSPSGRYRESGKLAYSPVHWISPTRRTTGTISVPYRSSSRMVTAFMSGLFPVPRRST